MICLSLWSQKRVDKKVETFIVFVRLLLWLLCLTVVLSKLITFSFGDVIICYRSSLVAPESFN